MRRSIILIISLFLAFACKKPDVGPVEQPKPGGGGDKPVATELSIDPSSIVLPSSGGEQTVEVKCNGNWTLSGSVDWCSVSASKGEGNAVIKFSVSPNDTFDERNATYTFSSGDKTAKLSIVQKQKDALTLTRSKFELEPEACRIEIEVKANVEYEYVIPEECLSWISPAAKTKALESSLLVFDIAENTDVERREGSIVISSGDISETVSIYQNGLSPSIVLSRDSYIVPASGKTIKVELSANIDYEVQMPDNDWVSESVRRAKSTHTHYYTIAPNESYDQRKAQIIFINRENQIQQAVTIVQAQRDAIILAKTEYEMPEEGGTIEVEVQHNVDYDVTSSSWIHLYPSTRSLSTSKLTFTVDANPSYDGRSGFITISSGSISQTITVLQGQCDVIVIGKKDYVLSSEEQSFNITVNSNIEFEVSIPAVGWLRQISTRALTGSTLTISVDRNTEYSGRTAEILIQSVDGQITETVTVTQAQRDAIILAKTEYEMPEEGGTIEVEVQHNVDYDVTSSSWIHLYPSTRSLSTSKLTFTVDANPSYDGRSGFITISSGSISQTITVLQGQCDVLTLSTNRAEISSNGGNVSVTVKTNLPFSYSIPEPAQAWISSVPATRALSDNTVTFAVAENLTYDSRSAEIIFTSEEGNLKETFTITQLQKDEILVEDEELAVGSEGGILTLDIQHNVDYEVYSSDWIHLQPQTRSLQTSSLSFMVDGNTSYQSRTGYIEISNGPISRRITVVQEQTDRLDLSVSEAEFKTEGGSSQVYLYANVEYVIAIPEEDKEWIEYSVTDYDDYDLITFTVQENTLTEARESEIIFESADGTLRRTYTVSQAQKDSLSVDVPEFEVGRDACEIQVKVQANVAYTVNVDYSSRSWISLVSDNDGLLTLSIAENSTFGTRTGKVTVKDSRNSLSAEVTIIQEASKMTLSLSTDSVVMPRKRSTQSVEVATNANSWRVESNATSWCYVSPSYGSGSSNTFTITVYENKGTEQREATVTVKATAYDNNNNQIIETRTITVVQQPVAALTLPGTNLEIEHKPDTKAVAVISNADWTAVSDSDWCVLDKASGSGDGELILSVSSNSGDAPRVATVTVTAKFDEDNMVTSSFTVTQYDENGFTVGGWGENPGDHGGEAQ